MLTIETKTLCKKFFNSEEMKKDEGRKTEWKKKMWYWWAYYV